MYAIYLRKSCADGELKIKKDILLRHEREFFEFGLFMSRREYKTINRRLNAGRFASCREGKYAGAHRHTDTPKKN